MKCLSTRATPEGFRRRRYERADGSRFNTIEVPLTVWTAINRQGRGTDRAAAWARGQARQQVRQQALLMLNSGWKPLAVERDLGVPVRTLQRWKKGQLAAPASGGTTRKELKK